MDLHRFSSIGRPIDLSYPTNRAIVLLAAGVLVVIVAVGLLGGWTVAEAGIRAGGMAVAVFLGWALGRELDPDHELSAFVGASLALLALWVAGRTSLAGPFLLLLLLRAVNRTTGLAARTGDSLVILGLAAWLTLRANWPLGVVATLAFFLDATQPPAHRRQLAFAAAAALATVVSVTVHGLGRAGQEALGWPGVAALAATLPFLSVMSDSRTVRSRADTGGERLDPRRVRSAQALGLLTVLLAAVIQRREGLVLLLPLWAAIAGVGLYRLATAGLVGGSWRGRSREA